MKFEQPLFTLGQVYQPGSLLLLSTGAAEAAHVMPVAWHTHMQQHPELIACILRRDSKALQGLMRGRCCALNVPTTDQLATVMQRGGLSSLHADRCTGQPWALEPCQQVAACALRDCPAHIECELLHTRAIGGLMLCLLQPVHIRTSAAWELSSEPGMPLRSGHGRVHLRGQDLATSAHLLEPGLRLKLVPA